MLAWMVDEKDIEPHVPVWDKTERKNDSPETGSVATTRNDLCERRIYLGGCGTESKKTGKTDLTRAAGHGIGTPGNSKKPQTNPPTKLQRSTQNEKATQRGG
jgi:hypothetical protein